MAKTAARRKSGQRSPRLSPAAPAAPSSAEPRILELSRKVVESCLLAAAFVVPVYFSVLTSPGYEADQAVIVRVLGAIAGTAWLLSWRWNFRLPGPSLRNAIIAVAGVLFLADA